MSHVYQTQEELAAADGYLSRCEPCLARLQRERRRRLIRIDYMPGKEALAILAARRDQAFRTLGRHYLTTNSAVIDAIVLEWAALTGIDNSENAAAPTGPRIAARTTRRCMSKALNGEAERPRS